MNYFFDSNIILFYVRQDKKRIDFIEQKYGKLLLTSSRPVASVVSLGELRSIAIQKNWSRKKKDVLENLMNRFIVADINIESIVNRYAEIDAFSQGKLSTLPLGTSARNMGKNDLWIAATASILGLTLITSDKDFHHLNGIYLNLAFVNLDEISILPPQ